MSAYADYAVVEGGETSLFYDKWGAYFLLELLFFGPERALGPIHSSNSTDTMRNWAEAGVLIDIDAKHLLFYLSVPFAHAEYREVLLGLMRTNWTGWRVDWSHGGAAEIAASCGRDPSHLQPTFEEHDFQPHDLLPLPTEYWAQTLITIKDGPLFKDIGFGGEGITNLLAVGPSLGDAIKAFPEFIFETPGLVEDFEAGALIDFDRRRVDFWNTWGYHHERYLHVIQAKWSGWTVEINREGLPGQFIRSGRDPAPVLIGSDKLVSLISDHMTNPSPFLGESTSDFDKQAILARSIAEYRETRSTSPGGQSLAAGA